MNIDEENKAKEFYIKSAINGIHTPRTNMVEINYLDMLKLMHSYSEEVVKNLSISGVSVSFTDRLFEIAYDYESSVSERMEQIKTLLVNKR